MTAPQHSPFSDFRLKRVERNRFKTASAPRLLLRTRGGGGAHTILSFKANHAMEAHEEFLGSVEP